MSAVLTLLCISDVRVVPERTTAVTWFDRRDCRSWFDVIENVEAGESVLKSRNLALPAFINQFQIHVLKPGTKMWEGWHVGVLGLIFQSPFRNVRTPNRLQLSITSLSRGNL